jgi:hypothetical protein
MDVEADRERRVSTQHLPHQEIGLGEVGDVVAGHPFGEREREVLPGGRRGRLGPED